MGKLIKFIRFRIRIDVIEHIKCIPTSLGHYLKFVRLMFTFFMIRIY